MRIITDDTQLVVGKQYMLVRDTQYCPVLDFINSVDSTDWWNLEDVVELRKERTGWMVVFPAGTILTHTRTYGDCPGAGNEFVVGPHNVKIDFQWLAEEDLGEFVVEL